jgi:hypothetical protein
VLWRPYGLIASICMEEVVMLGTSRLCKEKGMACYEEQGCQSYILHGRIEKRRWG